MNRVYLLCTSYLFDKFISARLLGIDEISFFEIFKGEGIELTYERLMGMNFTEPLLGIKSGAAKTEFTASACPLAHGDSFGE